MEILGIVIAVVTAIGIGFVVVKVVFPAFVKAGQEAELRDRQAKAELRKLLVTNAGGPDFQWDGYRAEYSGSGFELSNKKFIVAIYRRSTFLRLIYEYNRQKRWHDLRFSDIVDIELGWTTGTTPYNVTTIISTSELYPELSFFDSTRSLYNNLRSALRR